MQSATLTPATKPTATVSLDTAAVFVAELRRGTGRLSSDLADSIQSRMTVADLSGTGRVDLDAAMTEAFALEGSIDALIDLVIDLR